MLKGMLKERLASKGFPHSSNEGRSFQPPTNPPGFRGLQVDQFAGSFERESSFSKKGC